MDNSRGKLNQLTSIRGIAAWWVVLFHSQMLFDDSLPPALANVIAHGYLAVDLFFILSGFVIYLNYNSKVASGFPASAIAFYLNRFARIYPVHLLMLGSYLLLAGAFVYFSKSGVTPDSYSAKSFVESVFLIHAWFGTGMSWNVPSWSISAEWFVYLLFPLITLILRKHLKTMLSHIAISAFILALIYCTYSAMDVNSLGTDILSMALIRVCFEFLLGTIIGSAYVSHLAFLKQYKKWILIAFAVISIIYVNFDIKDYVLFPAAFFFLIIYMCVEDSILQTVFSNRVLVYLGEISYSTYMVHYLVYDLFKAVWVSESSNVNQGYLALSFLAVLLMSMLTYHFVEMPSQKYLRGRLVRL